ncbi:MAG: basic amino acid ABC transporter substrate-binding protein [Treponema sp.]|nr:basic amino acid ABC transporter substrate-binding protein [Treponema sp.]
MKVTTKTLLALLVLAVAGLPALAQNLPKIVFGSDCTFPPMEFLDTNKQIVGFDVDLINAAAKAAGFEAVVKNTAWDGIFAGLEAGDYDAVLSSVTITDQRKKVMDFSVPYVNAGQVLIVRKTTEGVTELSQLAGKDVGAQIGTTGAIEVAKHPDIKLKTYDEIGLAVDDLVIGRLEGVVVDSPTAASYVLQNPTYKAKLMIVGAPFTSEFYGVAVKKGDTKDLDLINKGLEAVIKDGTRDALVKKWLQ